MAEALVDEIDHPDTGLVSRDFLRAELQTLRTELQTLRADLIGTIWRVVLTVFGIQVVLVGVLVAIPSRNAGKGPDLTAAEDGDGTTHRSTTSRRALTSWRMWC
jgi:hypothetical protein